MRPLLKPMRALDAGRGAARAAGGGGVREHARRQLGAGARHALGADARSDRPGALPGYLAVLAGPRSRGDCVLCLQRVGSAERDSGASARAATGRPAAQEALRQLDPELLQRLAQHMDVTDLITLFVHPRLALGLSDRDFTEVGRLTSPAWRGVHAAIQARVACVQAARHAATKGAGAASAMRPRTGPRPGPAGGRRASPGERARRATCAQQPRAARAAGGLRGAAAPGRRRAHAAASERGADRRTARACARRAAAGARARRTASGWQGAPSAAVCAACVPPWPQAGRPQLGASNACGRGRAAAAIAAAWARAACAWTTLTTARLCARCPACTTSTTRAWTPGCGSRASPRPAPSARRPCSRRRSHAARRGPCGRPRPRAAGRARRRPARTGHAGACLAQRPPAAQRQPGASAVPRWLTARGRGGRTGDARAPAGPGALAWAAGSSRAAR